VIRTQEAPSDSEYHDAQGTVLNFEHTDQRQSKTDKGPRLFWYRLTDLVGKHWITPDPEEMEVMRKARFTVIKVFSSRLEAVEWQQEGDPLVQPPSDQSTRNRHTSDTQHSVDSEDAVEV